MSKVYETLKKKNDTSVEVYPNIERTNIPDGAINTAKIEDGAINYNKLNDALKQQSADFDSIYNHEDDELNVTELNVTDDIDCSNINVDSNVNATDIKATNSITSDTYYDGQNDELKVMVRHCLLMKLINNVDPSDIRQLGICFTSTHKEAFTTFSELVAEFNKMIYHPVADRGYDYMGYISSVNTNTGQISIYCWDGTQPEEIDFYSADSIQDAVYPI